MTTTLQYPRHEFKVVDAAAGIVDAVCSVTNIVDFVGDIVVPGAYEDTLAFRKPKVVWGHDWKHMIGKVVTVDELYPGDPRLPDDLRALGAGALKARIQMALSTTAGREAWEFVQFYDTEGEWSIGYDANAPRGKARRRGDGIRELLAVNLYELSFVLFGAAPGTRTTSIKSDGGLLTIETKSRPQTGIETKGGVMDLTEMSVAEIAEYLVLTKGISPQAASARARLAWMTRRHGGGGSRVSSAKPSAAHRPARSETHRAFAEKYAPGTQLNASLQKFHKRTLSKYDDEYVSGPALDRAEFSDDALMDAYMNDRYSANDNRRNLDVMHASGRTWSVATTRVEHALGKRGLIPGIEADRTPGPEVRTPRNEKQRAFVASMKPGSADRKRVEQLAAGARPGYGREEARMSDDDLIELIGKTPTSQRDGDSYIWDMKKSSAIISLGHVASQLIARGFVPEDRTRRPGQVGGVR